MRRRRLPVSFLVAMVLAIGLAGGWWHLRGDRIQVKRHALAALQHRLNSATARSDSARRMAEDLRNELFALREKRLRTLVEVKRVTEQFAAPAVSDPWAELPSGENKWLPQSPYVWLSKATLQTLSSQPFTRRGELRPEYAEALAISEPQRRRVGEALQRVMKELEELQVAYAERSVSPPSAEGESEKITVRIPPMPEHADRLQAQVEAALESELGVQRKELLLNLSRHVIDSKLKSFGTTEENISVKRTKYGTFQIKWANGSMVSGPTRLDDNVPAHLLPFFAELQPVQLSAE